MTRHKESPEEAEAAAAEAGAKVAAKEAKAEAKAEALRKFSLQVVLDNAHAKPVHVEWYPTDQAAQDAVGDIGKSGFLYIRSDNGTVTIIPRSRVAVYRVVPKGGE